MAEHCNKSLWCCLVIVQLVTSSLTVGGSQSDERVAPSKMFKVFHTLATNITDAMVKCDSIGMTLATIENHNDTRLAQAVTSNTRQFYFTAGFIIMNRWTWITNGQPIGPYTQWFGIYPNTGKCLKFYSKMSPHENWASTSCGSAAYPLCQYHKMTGDGTPKWMKHIDGNMPCQLERADPKIAALKRINAKWEEVFAELTKAQKRNGH